MAEKQNDDDAALHTVDTVPPPDGEHDAYNAPTRVGPMAQSLVAEIMNHAERTGAKQEPLKNGEAKAKPTAKPPRPSKKPVAVNTPVPPEPSAIPRFFDEAEGEGSMSAQGQVGAPRATPSDDRMPSFVDEVDETGQKDGLTARDRDAADRDAARSSERGVAARTAGPAAERIKPSHANWDWWVIAMIVVAAGVAVFFLRS